MTPTEDTTKISDPVADQRTENAQAGRDDNHMVPGWDAQAPDAEGIELVCPNPACEETLDAKGGVTTLTCPYCGTYYTAPRAGFTSDVIRDQNLAANQADPDRDNFQTVAASQGPPKAKAKAKADDDTKVDSGA